MNSTLDSSPAPPGKFTGGELFIAVGVFAVLGVLGYIQLRTNPGPALAQSVHKIKLLSEAFTEYTTDNGGLLPLEDVPGADDWSAAAKPEAEDVWYNALPKLMAAKTVGEIGKEDPEEFYQNPCPLFLPDAPYPKSDKKFTRPYFAVAMNSRLQQQDEEGTKVRGSISSFLQPESTVVFLERGLPSDKKSSKVQRRFNGNPKAGPFAFAERRGGQGILVFMDGHIEAHSFADLVGLNGRIIVQDGIIWTANSEDDPN